MSFLESIKRFYASSIGKKLLVAVTGLGLLLFVFGHMVGNLLLFMGRDAINSYAEFLKHGLLHGAGVWLARIGLLGTVAVHIIATIHLTRQNREAREHRYEFESTAKATPASRTMIISGVIILSFVIFHLMQFTVLPGPGQEGYWDLTGDHPRHDVYGMVIRGFQNVFISLFYIVSVAFLCLHMSHGFSSVFQTLGLRTDKSWPIIVAAGYAYSALIFIGNSLIPLSVLFGFVTLN